MMTGKLFTHILVPLENTRADETILVHARRIAHYCGARMTILHVADGFAARHQDRLDESPEIKQDREYLGTRREELLKDGLEVEAVLEFGDPAERILAFAHESGVDLITMATHGHRGLSDIILGSAASSVRHRTDIPVLLVRVPHDSSVEH